MMADDQVRAVMSKMPDVVVKPPQLPSELYAIFIKQSPIASLIAMYYVLQASNAGWGGQLVTLFFELCLWEWGCD